MAVKVPRFTTGLLMVAVAVVAGLLGVASLIRRRGEVLRSMSLSHRSEAYSTADTAWGFQRFGIGTDGTVPEENARQADHYWQLYAYHLELGVKYERAARRPWLPVAPDPPVPN